MIVTASAPGKVVISGEYAVLEGAPALVMAVNRRCKVRLAPRTSGSTGWRFVCRGYEGQAEHRIDELTSTIALPRDDPAALAQRVLASAHFEHLPEHLDLSLDSRAAYLDGTKLGIGSSAAICVALTTALVALGEQADTLSIAMAAHRAFQQGRGSGLDVATAHLGGFVRFERGLGEHRAWPAGVKYRFVFTGAAASTTDQLAKFERGRRTNHATNVLCAAAAAVAEASDAWFVRELGAYTDALAEFDRAMNLGVYSKSHRDIAALAAAHDVVYKPCGAGGGDIGVGIATDDEALERFGRVVETAGYRTLDLELDEHGVLVDIAG